MRQASLGASIVATALVLSGAARAQAPATQQQPVNAALTALLAPDAGNKACYIRRYDAAHLNAHPRQRITAMTFLLAVAAYDPKPAQAERPEDRVYYTFAMSVSRRGDKRLLRTSGDCSSGDTISCAVDCDGGRVTLDKLPPANALIVRLDKDGIRMFHDCDEEVGVLVASGADDKVFRLDKVAPEACRPLDAQ